jgi:hypothetical protein
MKPKLLFQDIASTITGFSTPVIGIQWTPPKREKEIAGKPFSSGIVL